jgi:peptidoglycan-associated lipoprotein
MTPIDARIFTLSIAAKLLRDHPELKLTPERHCDERDTVEYNRSLGERRANAARDYPTAAGVSSAQVRTVSYGEERPYCLESNESCWAMNRRGHFPLR